MTITETDTEVDTTAKIAMIDIDQIGMNVGTINTIAITTGTTSAMIVAITTTIATAMIANTTPVVETINIGHGLVHAAQILVSQSIIIETEIVIGTKTISTATAKTLADH